MVVVVVEAEKVRSEWVQWMVFIVEDEEVLCVGHEGRFGVDFLADPEELEGEDVAVFGAISGRADGDVEVLWRGCWDSGIGRGVGSLGMSWSDQVQEAIMERGIFFR